jgi:hypothetical protein
MKLLTFATIVAAAGIGQVLAAPLLVVTSNITPSVNPPRFGHGVAGKAEFVGKMKKGPCGRNRFRQKAVEISNLFREALGLPLIKSGNHHGLGDGEIRILPFIGTPNIFAPVHGKDADGAIKFISIETPHDHGYHAHGRHHHKGHHHFGKGSFLNRIQYSIMNLGRWEGRAVAFVLGCGIGVLLRMVFVLAVVMYRAVKGRGEEQHEYSQITIIEEIVNNPNTSPPSYLDEKVPIVDETVQAPKSSPPSYVNENYPIVVETVKAPTEESK